MCLINLIAAPTFGDSSHSTGSFVGLTKPRYPIHFDVGNSFNPPTTFDAVRSFALQNRVHGMEHFTENDWLDIKGQIVIYQGQDNTKFFLDMNGLVPGGLYTAWLVRKTGSPLGNKADLDLGNGYVSGTGKPIHTNVIFADVKGHGHLRASLDNDFADADGQAFVNLDQWDEIHIAFHADNLAHGTTPGPYHWTQMIFPVR
jgi:hypothetical protein